MIYSLVGELPRHIYCFVDSTYTHNELELPSGLRRQTDVWSAE